MEAEMIPDWHWLQGRLEQDAALDKFEKSIEDLEKARDEWYKAVWWHNFNVIHRN